jgi:hypothetical protein
VDQLLSTIAEGCQKDSSYLNLKFYHISPLYKFQKKGGKIIVMIQECFIFAPDNVLSSILTNVLCSAGNGKNNHIRQYTSGSAYQEHREYLEYLAIPPNSYSAGRIYNLQTSFNRVNHHYFDGGIPQPHLVWSQRLTRRKFGHYQSDINTISISRTLDQPHVPAFVIDYVMYHELLHKVLGAKQVNDRNYTHTPAFKKEESKFERIKEAQEILSSLTHKRT